MKFWAIVGDGDTRKSSAIRGLTGAARRRPNWRIGLINQSEILAFVEISAPQERQLPLTPAEFVDLVHEETAGHDTTGNG